jgi:hypothetical protein
MLTLGCHLTLSGVRRISPCPVARRLFADVPLTGARIFDNRREQTYSLGVFIGF